MLLRLLRVRFGVISQELEARIQAADTAQLERWAERIMTAATAEEVVEG